MRKNKFPGKTGRTVAGQGITSAIKTICARDYNQTKKQKANLPERIRKYGRMLLNFVK